MPDSLDQVNRTPPGWIPYRGFPADLPAELAAFNFYERMSQRRSVRMFSSRPVSQATIRHCIAAAGTAPSGANKQPWRFVAVADPLLKREIRNGAEAEEREFYERRASAEWLADLAPLGTDSNKEFLEIAPWLIVVFALTRDDMAPPERRGLVYYLNESVGIACGLLLAAIHHAGLVALTHTPSPMAFLREILQRPAYERPYLLIPVGYPADDCVVPDITRKPLEQILVIR